MTKRIALSAAVGLLLAAGVALFTLREPVSYHGTHIAPPMEAEGFTLQSADGPVSLSDLEGRTVALFFGYTSCPDVCPATLLRLSNALNQLGDAGEDIQVVFVSVDPERDTPERASGYARSVDPSFVGLSGSPEEVAEVASAYGIYHAKAEGSDATGYLVDHSTTVTVLDPAGRRVLLWSSTVTADQMAEDLETLL